MAYSLFIGVELSQKVAALHLAHFPGLIVELEQQSFFSILANYALGSSPRTICDQPVLPRQGITNIREPYLNAINQLLHFRLIPLEPTKTMHNPFNPCLSRLIIRPAL